MELVGMRQAAVCEPELLVEALCIDDESVAFPLCNGTAIIKRVVIVTAQLAFLLTAVRINDPVVSVAASDKYKDAFPVPVFTKLESVRLLELAGTTRRHAVQVH